MGMIVRNGIGYGGYTNVIDSLESSSTISALSAKQGKVLNEKIDKINNSIAPTEDDTTASKAYAIGEYFFRNGDFCKCISDISSGGSFILNTNYSVTSLANELYLALHQN